MFWTWKLTHILMIIVIQSGTKCSEDELLSKGEKSREHPLDVFVCTTEILRFALNDITECQQVYCHLNLMDTYTKNRVNPCNPCLKRDAYFDFHEYPYRNAPNTACITRVRCSVPSMLSKGKPRTKVR